MRGVLLHAYNNGLIDYSRLAWCCGNLIAKNLKVPVSIVTDEPTWGRLREIDAENLFDKTIINPIDTNVDNWRAYSSGGSDSEMGRFLNHSRSDSYDITPYEETLLVDLDYLVYTGELNKVWGSPEPLMMNSYIHQTLHDNDFDSNTRVFPLGVKQYWATVVYFRKSKYTKTFFDLVKHVEDNYMYYAVMYGFRSSMFRNDHTFSIAAHIDSGYTGLDSIKPLPVDGLMFSQERDSVRGVIRDGLILERFGKHFPIKIQNHDIHVMNKKSLLGVSQDIVESIL